MAKLYFRYGCMNSSKTAQALMVKYNYEQQGKTVALLKPSVDTRTEEDVVRSRIGLEGRAIPFRRDEDLCGVCLGGRFFRYSGGKPRPDVVIVDEAQFLTAAQVGQLKALAMENIPVLCYGLKTDFRTSLFEGSKRLFEIADSIQEIKTVCECGRKAEVNARFKDGEIVWEGEQIQIGGNESYRPMCYSCWAREIRKRRAGARARRSAGQ